MAGGDPKIAEQQSILAEYVYVLSSFSSPFPLPLPFAVLPLPLLSSPLTSFVALDEVLADK